MSSILRIDGRPYAYWSSDTAGFESGVGMIIELRAVLDHNDKDLIFVKDLAKIFYYDAFSTAADDGATVLKPDDVGAGDPGRWLVVPGTGGGGLSPSFEAAKGTTVRVTTTSYGLMDGMVLNPGPGTYVAQFSANFRRTGSPVDVFIQLAVGSTLQPESKRSFRLTTTFKEVTTIDRLVVPAAESVTVQCRGSNTNEIELSTRTLLLTRVQ